MRSAFLVVVFVALTARAASIDLPLNGYYRVGRYMPLHVAAEPCERLWIEGDGVLPISVDAKGAAIDAVFPLLIIGSPTAIFVRDDKGNSQTFPVQLQLLRPDQRLMGSIGEVLDAPQRLFPGKSHIVVPLAPVQAVRGAPVAWETLDAIVSDGPVPGAGDDVYRPLLGCGVIFAVRSNSAPDRTWPWLREGPWQVLRHEAVGPQSALAGEIAYLPARGWSPGVPRRLRMIVLSAGVIAAILMLAATLLRGRGGAIAVAAVAMGSICVIAGTARRQSPARTVDTAVLVSNGPFVQYDVWQFQTTTAAANVTLPWTRPMLISPEQVARQRLMLECYSNGQSKQLSAHLEAGEVLAAMMKFVEVRKLQLSTDAATDSPTHALVREVYLRPGVRVVGQSMLDRGNEAYFPPVVLEIVTP